MDGLAHCATSVFDILGVSMDPAKNPGSVTATRVGVDSSVIRYKFEFNGWKKTRKFTMLKFTDRHIILISKTNYYKFNI